MINTVYIEFPNKFDSILVYGSAIQSITAQDSEQEINFIFHLHGGGNKLVVITPPYRLSALDMERKYQDLINMARDNVLRNLTISTNCLLTSEMIG